MPDGTTLRKAKLRGLESNGMILAEDELAIGHRPRRDHRARRRPARGRIAAGRRAADLDRRDRARDHAEPPRLPGDLRRRPRGPCRHRRAAARAPVERGPGDRRRRRRDRDHRRVPRPVPAVHRSRVRGREDRPEPGVAEGPADGGRPAADLQRRRHHQLRDAADRAAAARVRPRPRGRAAADDPAGGAGGDGRHARRPDAGARRPDGADRRRRRPDLDRRRDGRSALRGAGRHHPGADGGRQLGRPQHPPHVAAAGSAQRGVRRASRSRSSPSRRSRPRRSPRR